VTAEGYPTLVLFFQYDRDIPLNARVLERDQTDARIREKIVVSGLPPSRVPGYLFIPALGSPPYPCVLLAHGVGGSKENSSAIGPNQTNITKELLSAGLAVLVLDASFHGERTADIDFESIHSQMRPNIYREVVVQWTVEYRRAIDYLTTRSELDSERIGILG
jgi:dienelactone hydrolase